MAVLPGGGYVFISVGSAFTAFKKSSTVKAEFSPVTPSTSPRLSSW